MATLTQVRDALAQYFGTALGVPHRVGRQPSPLFPLTVFTVPTDGADYLDWNDETPWDRPIVALSLIVVGPAANLDVSYQWIDTAALTVAAAAVNHPDGTLGGLISGLLLSRVRRPGWLTVEGTSPVLSAEMVLAPFYLRT